MVMDAKIEALASVQAAELCAVGSIAGAAQSLGGHALVKVHQIKDKSFQPSLAVPELKRSSGGLAAYMGTLAHARYQLLGGLDRFAYLHSSYYVQPETLFPSWAILRAQHSVTTHLDHFALKRVRIH